jgi:hypothetical protein
VFLSRRHTECNKFGACSQRITSPFIEEETPFLNTKPSWNENKLDHGSGPGLKPRMIVLARARRYLMDWTGITDGRDQLNMLLRWAQVP